MPTSAMTHGGRAPDGDRNHSRWPRGDSRTDASPGPLVGTAGNELHGPVAVRDLFDVGGLPERELLRAAVPVALLFAVHRDVVREDGRAAPVVDRQLVDDLAGHHHPDRSAGFPTDLLLLPKGVLPRVLAVASGVRGGRATRTLHG